MKLPMVWVKLLSLCVVCFALFVVTLAYPSRAAAWDPFQGYDCGGSASGSAVCADKGKGGTNPLTGSNGVILKIADVTALLGGIAAVFVLIIAGVQYIMSDGEAGKIKQAKDMAIYALVGLVVMAIAGSIVSYLLTRV